MAKNREVKRKSQGMFPPQAPTHPNDLAVVLDHQEDIAVVGNLTLLAVGHSQDRAVGLGPPLQSHYRYLTQILISSEVFGLRPTSL